MSERRAVILPAGDIRQVVHMAHVAEDFAVLDTLLSAGGPPPADWADCAPARPVTDVPGLATFASSVPPGLEIAPGAYSVVAGGPDIAADVREAQHRIEAGEIADTWAPDVSERAALISGLAAALRSLAEKDAEISRLTAELDATRNAPVEYVITAGLEAAMAADPHREDGTILRTTDGEREAWAWKAATKEWEQIH